jgi:hypothetical protein
MQPYNVRMQQQSWVDAALAMPWIAWSVGGLLIALGLFLLWLFLFSDRSRGRRRCPKCWYDLRGTSGLRCSECGHMARRERALFRTRRRWRGAISAIPVLGIGIFTTVVPKVRSDGWASLLPTTCLLWLAPACSGSDRFPPWPSARHWTEIELDRRDAAASLADWQWRYVLLHKQGLRYRNAWPFDYPLVIGTNHADWGGRWDITVTNSVAISTNRMRTARPNADGRNVLGVIINSFLPHGQRSTLLPTAGYSWLGAVELPIQPVPTIDVVMKRLGGSEIDRLVGQALQIQISLPSAASKYCPVRCVLNRARDPRLADLAFGFHITVRDSARIIETFMFQATPQSDNSVGLETSFSLHGLMQSDEWWIEIRGDPKEALCDWDRNSFWDGMIELTPSEIWIEGRDPVEMRR